VSTDPITATINTSEAEALALDAADPLARFRQRFHLLPGRIYLDGNSLGLLSRDAEAETLRALEQWKTLGIDGWLGADPPWFTLGEDLGALLAPLVGAEPEAVVVTGATTVNQHALTATFYRPHGARRKIVATALDFPPTSTPCRASSTSMAATRGTTSCSSPLAMGARSPRRMSSPH
jgi:kynureninase